MNLLYYIGTFALIAVNIVIAAFVYLRNQKDTVNRIFTALVLSISSWIFVNFMADNSKGYMALIWTKLTFVTTAFFAWLLLLFVLVFPVRKKISALAFNMALFIPNLVICLLMLTNLIVKGVEIQPWGVNVIFGPANVAFAIYFLGYTTAAIIILIQNVYKTKGRIKSQGQYVLLGLALGIFFATITNLIIPFIFNLFYPSKYGHFFTVFFVAFTAYAITKHELMDIRVVISRTMAYGASIFTILLLGAGAIYINTVFFHNFPVLQFAIVAALALTAVAIFEPIRKFIQTPLEEKWITGWYDPTKVMSRIAEKLVPVLEKDEAFRIVGEELKNAIKIKKVEILVGSECPKISEINRVGKSVEIPLKSSAGLEGVLRLGEKISEDPYDEKDLTLFRTIQAQILAILDRIRPYEQVKKDFEASQKKLYEAERMLERSQRLASLGTIAAGVAHEIRNPLTVIYSKTARLTDQLRDKEYLEAFKKDVLESAERINNIIKEMYNLSKVKEKKGVRVNLNEIISATLELILISRIQLKRELYPVSDIIADPEDLKQVFINLIDNAIKAMPEGGTLTLSTYQEENKVCAKVSDTGCGIPPENLPRIFDPFFSTRHEGVGLGLSIAHRIVIEHNGTIEVTSKVGEGTTFTLKFPAAKD